MHKILVIRLYFPLDALCSTCFGLYSFIIRSNVISCTSHLVYAGIRRYAWLLCGYSHTTARLMVRKFEMFSFNHNNNFVRIGVIFVNMRHCLLLEMHRQIWILNTLLKTRLTTNSVTSIIFDVLNIFLFQRSLFRAFLMVDWRHVDSPLCVY